LSSFFSALAGAFAAGLLALAGALVLAAADGDAAGDEVVFAGDEVVFAGLALVLLVFDGVSGQAAPNKPNVKTAERAITFFISIIFSCLLQRMYIYFIV